MHAEGKLLRFYGPGKCPQAWTWLKGKTLKNLIQWRKGTGFAFQRVAVVAAWREMGLQEGGSGQPCPLCTWGLCMHHYLIEVFLFL